MQLSHYNSRFSTREFPIVVVADHITSDFNIGSLFRVCDAFGVQKIYLCGVDEPPGRNMRKTSRATENAVNFEITDDTFSVVKKLKAQDFSIISLEITSQSLPLHTYKFKVQKPIALVVGDENFGISEQVLKTSDAIIHIEMYGQNSSMNVSQATNIALYELTKQML